jgi:1-acyl-sn-glycerol-3-phosphate acyltransferase
LSYCYWIFKVVFYVFFKIYNRLEVLNPERVPGEGGAIIASNHASYLDPLVLSAASRRRMTYMAKESLFGIPLIGAFVNSFSFPVKRGRPNPSTIKEAVRRLRAGQLIAMFPEGGRSAAGEAKRGIGLIAKMSGAPIVPVLIEGTDNALPGGARFIKPSKIRVKFGHAIGIDGMDDKDGQEKIASDVLKSIEGMEKE